MNLASITVKYDSSVPCVKADGSKVVYIIAFIRGIVLYRQHIGKRITNLLQRQVHYVKPTGKLFYFREGITG